MLAIALAAAFFLGIHLFVAGTRLRDRLVARLGEPVYLLLFSALSLVAISALCVAWVRGPVMAPLWNGAPLRPVVQVATFVAFVLVVVGLLTPSPTALGGESRLGSDEPARGILRITRHPFLWGVAIWALGHVLVNPDPPSLLFFGTFLVLALVGPPSIDAKRRRRQGEAWARFAGVTSNVPFAAIASGRNRLVLGELASWPLAAAVVLWVVILALHGTLFGVPAV